MNKKEFDDKFISEIASVETGEPVKYIIYDPKFYAKIKASVPIEYISTVEIQPLGPPECESVRASLRGTREVDSEGRELIASAQVRQRVIRNYPTNRQARADNPFFSEGMKEASDRPTPPSNRMAFPDVQRYTGDRETTREDVNAILGNFPNRQIVEILSPFPVINMQQFRAIQANLVSIDDIMYGRKHDDPKDPNFGKRVGGQLVRYPIDATDVIDGKEVKVGGLPILRNGQQQFRLNILDLHGEYFDIDFRSAVISPITQAQRLTFSEASKHQLQVTGDMKEHEGKYTRSGSAEDAVGYRKEHKEFENAFAGLNTTTKPAVGDQTHTAANSPAPKDLKEGTIGPEGGLISPELPGTEE